MQDKTIGSLSKEESERMQEYIKEISRIFGVRLVEIGEFLRKKLRNDAKGAHEWFIAFMVIDEIFDEMEEKFLEYFCVDASRRKFIKSIIKETKEKIKEELPLPKEEKKQWKI